MGITWECLHWSRDIAFVHNLFNILNGNSYFIWCICIITLDVWSGPGVVFFEISIGLCVSCIVTAWLQSSSLFDAKFSYCCSSFNLTRAGTTDSVLKYKYWIFGICIFEYRSSNVCFWYLYRYFTYTVPAKNQRCLTISFFLKIKVVISIRFLLL